MQEEYKKIIEAVQKEGGLLDAMHALQEKDGYLSETGIRALSESFGMHPNQIYETASFYSMLRTKPADANTEILICRGAPCHVAGARELVKAIEQELGIQVGETTLDGKFTFAYTECQGQCQASPALLINGVLHTQMTPDAAVELIRKEGGKK